MSDIQIDQIKNFFEKIKKYKNSNEKLFKLIQTKIISLKEIYFEYSKKYQQNQKHIIITLDTLHFQIRLIEEENKYNKLLFNLFINRMYGDYYKFYNYIIKYTETNANHISFKMVIKNNYPIYKDLGNINYDFNHICDLHHDILTLINELISISIVKKHELSEDESQSSSGINIENFVNVKKFNLTLLQEKIKLFNSCLINFSTFQTKYLKRFILKLKTNYDQIKADIQLETPTKLKRQNSIDNNESSTESNYSNDYSNENVIKEGILYIYESSDDSNIDELSDVDLIDNLTL